MVVHGDICWYTVHNDTLWTHACTVIWGRSAKNSEINAKIVILVDESKYSAKAVKPLVNDG